MSGIEGGFFDRHFEGIISVVIAAIMGVGGLCAYVMHRQTDQKLQGHQIEDLYKEITACNENITKLENIVREEIKLSKTEHKDLRDRQIIHGETLARLEGLSEK